MSDFEVDERISQLHSDWVQGHIPGFPDDDGPLIDALREVLGMEAIEAEAREHLRAQQQSP